MSDSINNQSAERIETELTPGSKLFRQYEVVRCLGDGASGKVYACKHPNFGSGLVALKVFPASIAGNEMMSQRLHREIIAGNKVDHNNVIRLYDCLRDKDQIALVLEYVDGQRLSDCGLKGRDLHWWVVTIMLQVASGLEAIHKRNLIHRDLKPDNILVTRDGVAKIADLGLAKAFLSPKGADLGEAITQVAKKRRSTNPGDVVGTLDYLSPESIATGVADQRGDIYALGVIGYELLAGKTPFDGESIIDVLLAKVEQDPSRIDLDQFSYGTALSQLIDTAISRDPEKRYQTARELKQALLAVREEMMGRRSPAPSRKPAELEPVSTTKTDSLVLSGQVSSRVAGDLQRGQSFGQAPNALLSGCVVGDSYSGVKAPLGGWLEFSPYLVAFLLIISLIAGVRSISQVSEVEPQVPETSAFAVNSGDRVFGPTEGKAPVIRIDGRKK